MIDLFAPRGRWGHQPSIAEQIEVGDCWHWTGGKNSAGYGHNADGLIHRQVYEALVSPIPEGLVTDHLCRNPGCVNPDHLEMVTVRENALRGFGFAGKRKNQTHCKRGHSLEDAYRYSGRRHCRTCVKERSKE